jgi:translation initiation factor IF-3
MELAQERELDLVEVAPTAEPPVCQVLDYGKFRYENTRRERIARRDQRAKASNVIRQVRLKTRIGEHDRSAKTRQVKRLLEEGSKVKVSVMFRGREITHPEIGMAVLRMVAEDLVDEARIERPPTFEGRFLSMLLTPVPPTSRKDAEPREPKGAKA